MFLLWVCFINKNFSISLFYLQASPAWEDYMDFLDAIVLNGLKQTSVASLQGMWYQVSEATLSVSDSVLM